MNRRGIGDKNLRTDRAYAEERNEPEAEQRWKAALLPALDIAQGIAYDRGNGSETGFIKTLKQKSAGREGKRA